MPNRKGVIRKMDELKQVGLEALVHHLQEQGLSPRLVENSVLAGRIGDTDLICHCTIVPTPPGTHEAITPVGFEVASSSESDPRSIRELVVGLSYDRKEGVEQATKLWCEGVFPPIRRAFDPAPVSEDEDDTLTHPFTMATQDMETGKVTDWEVFLGKVQLGGPNAGPFAAFLDEGKLLFLMMDALTSAARDVRMHWVKVYVAFQPDGSRTFECKLDNEDWEEGVRVLKGIRWPRVKGFVQYRQFLVMRLSESTNPQVRERLEAFAQEYQEDPPAAEKKKVADSAEQTPPRRRRWWPFGR